MARLLFYMLILFSAAARSHIWLVAGALASAMTYSGTAAIHALIIAADSANSLYDIDAVGIWAVVSISCLTIYPMLTRSATIPQIPTRPIFGFWGSLVSFGAIFALIALLRTYPTEPACRSTDGTLLSSISQVSNEDFNCSYSCFDARQVLRVPTDITVISKSRAFGPLFGLTVAAMLLTGMFGIFIGCQSCFLVPRKRTEAELRVILNRDTSRYLLTSKQRRYEELARKAARKELDTGEVPQKRGKCGAYFYAGLFLTVVVLNEVYILIDGGLPTSENPYAIGQWGPWVGVVLALVAAAIVRYSMPKFLERRKILDAERAAFELRKVPRVTPSQIYTTAHGVPRLSNTQDGSGSGHTTGTSAGPSANEVVDDHLQRGWAGNGTHGGPLQHGRFTLKSRPTV
ncbi:MAG: hypothetical protein Q9218_007571 [Villophora microphyllina]